MPFEPLDHLVRWHMGCIASRGYIDCDRAVRVRPVSCRGRFSRRRRRNRRPPVWRAVVRPARSFFARTILRPPPGKLHWAREGFKFHRMDGAQQAAIHRALVTVQRAVTTMTFPSCDQGDVIELIDRVEEELHSPRPNVTLMGTFLNSI